MRKVVEMHTIFVYSFLMDRDQRRLLLINSNTTASLTARLHQRACAFLGTSWTITAETASFGSPTSLSEPTSLLQGMLLWQRWTRL
jgi:hypothetical protein